MRFYNDPTTQNQQHKHDYGASFWGPIIAGGISAAGQVASANQTAGMSWRRARWASDRNREDAQLQRDFQERMASTSHQRQLRDLEAAGLNPMLALNGGAAVPQGAMANTSAPDAPDYSGVVTSAMEGIQLGMAKKRLKQELKNMKATLRS